MTMQSSGSGAAAIRSVVAEVGGGALPHIFHCTGDVTGNVPR